MTRLCTVPFTDAELNGDDWARGGQGTSGIMMTYKCKRAGELKWPRERWVSEHVREK